jgi:peptide chain release factor 1
LIPKIIFNQLGARKIQLTSSKKLSARSLLGERRSISVDGSVLVGVDRSFLIDGLSNNVDDSSESLRADGHLNRVTSVNNFLASNESLSRVESDSSDVRSTKMLGDLENKSVASSLDLHSIEDRRELSLKLHIDNGSDNLRHLADKRALGAEKSCRVR